MGTTSDSIDDISTYSLAEVVRGQKRIQDQIKSLEDKLDDQSHDYVRREEWDQRITLMNRDFGNVWDAIADLKSDLKPNRTSGWQIAAVIITAIVGAGSLLTTLIALIKFGG